MARSMWTGSLSFGLVSIPVGLYAGTVDRRPRFHQFERGTADRVRNKRVNERTGEEVAYEDMVKGTEVADGYVIIEPEELEAIAPGRSRLIEIHQFVDGGEIDPTYYRRTYFLAPNSDEAVKSYGLLRDALAEAGRVAIASFVMRGQQYLGAIRATADALVLETLYYADEVRVASDEVPRLPERGVATKKERNTAIQLIDSMTDTWQPADYTDSYRERVDELVGAKRSGEEVVAEGEPPTSTNVVDLMDALQRSVSRARGEKAAAAEADRQDDLAGMRKNDLDDLARELEVSGRSRMKRDELERAVRDARAAA
ncbi:MAG: Ku protein [Actinophytocola sp.]|nr:Ku protein [Actinophytocola sp.]